MIRLPTDASIQHLLASLQALQVKRKPGNASAIDMMIREVTVAVQRDRTGSTEIDGFSSTASGAEMDSTPHGNSSPSSPVERAALARPARDQHHELTALAVKRLDELVYAAQGLLAALHSLRDLTADIRPAPKFCEACTEHRPKGDKREVSHNGTVGNRLNKITGLCGHCYRFVVQSAQPNSREGFLPSPEQIRDHSARGHWRIRVKPTS